MRGERRECDVIATAEGIRIVPVRDIHSSGKSEPDVLLRLSSHVDNDEPAFDSYKKRFTITPGLAGRQMLDDLNGDPFNHIEIAVDKAEFVSYTQWLSVLAPRLAIELDGGSHLDRQRANRDAFIDSVFQSAGIPMLHIPVRGFYVYAELRRVIEQSLSSDDKKLATEPLK